MVGLRLRAPRVGRRAFRESAPRPIPRHGKAFQ